MAKRRAGAKDWDLQGHYANRVKPVLTNAPWVLRLTEHKGKPSPVMVIKERILPNGMAGVAEADDHALRLEDRGLLYGAPLRRVLPVLRGIVAGVMDAEGIPLELERFIGDDRISFRGNLPLDDLSGPKLALIFKLRERVQELERVELMARRVERFTREEAAYWFSRMTNFSEPANRWARAGMRTMLAGQPGDPAVELMLDRLRSAE